MGNIYVLGWYYGNSSINGVSLYSYGNYDCFLVKLNSSGTILYTKTFGSAGYDYPFSLDTDANGNVWVAGKFSFSMQVGSLSVSGASNSHFLFKLAANGNTEYVRNVCQSGSSDWGIGDLSRSSQGKLALVSNFSGNSAFQNQSLSGGGGYLAVIDEATGDIDWVNRAGAQAQLVDHEPGGNIIMLGLQTNSTDSLGSQPLPALNAANQLFIARVLPSGIPSRIQAMPKVTGSYQSTEGFRTLHVSGAGQVFLSGELESPMLASNSFSVALNVPHAAGKPQAVLLKLDDGFQGQWFVGAGSRDTLVKPNKNIGSGVHTDAAGNIVWCTMNDAYSVSATHLRLNNDTFNSASVSSRYAAHGIHLWKFSEPSIKTFSPTIRAYCPGDSVHVRYQKYGDFSSTNNFVLELSDSTGSFQSPIFIKSILDSSSGTLHGLMPLWLKRSDYYRFRVRGTSPAIQGAITVDRILVRGKPNASAGPDFLFCLGDTVTLKASGGGSYLWDSVPNAWQFDQEQLLAVPDSHAGFVVKVTDSLSSCFDYDTAYLFYRTKVMLKPIHDTLLCRGAELELIAEILEGDSSRVSYEWREVGGGLLSTSDTLYVVGDKARQIELIAWDSCSIYRDTLRFQILLRDSLRLEPRSDSLICRGAIFQIPALAKGGDSVGYQFYWMDSSFSNSFQQGPFFDSSLVASTKFGLKLMDGCTSFADSLLFTVNISEAPQVSLLDTLRTCYGDSLLIRANVTGGFGDSVSYRWMEGSFGMEDSFQKSFTQSEYVKVEIIDRCLFSDYDSVFVLVRSPLQLQVRSDTLICNGESLLLFVAGAEVDTAYYSFFWEGNAVASNYVQRTPHLSWQYPLRIRDNCTGSEHWDTVLVNVRDSLKINLLIDTPVCYGQELQFMPSFSGGLSSQYAIQWFDENGGLLSTATNYSAEIRDQKTLSIVLKDACTVHHDSLFIAVQSLAALSISPIADTLLCHGQIIQVNPILRGGLTANYRVRGFPLDSASLYSGIEVLSPVQETISLWDGCSDSVQLSFFIDMRDSLQLHLGDDTAICAEEELILNPSKSGGIPTAYSYAFQQQPGVQFPMSVLPIADSLFVVCLEDACSQPSCDSQWVIVNALPNSDFTLSDTVLCIPESVNLTSLFPATNASWYWTLSGSFSDSLRRDASFQLNLDKAGSYQIGLQVIDSNGCSKKNSAFKSFEAKGQPNAEFLVSDTVVDIGEIIELVQTDQSITSSYWSPATIQKVSPYHYTYTNNDTGLIELALIAANKWGCTDTFSREVRFKNPFLCYIPNAFHPHGYRDNQVFLPRCEEAAFFALLIYDRWGALVFETHDQNLAWDGSWRGEGNTLLPSGVYLYRLRMKNQYGESFETSGTVTLLK